MNLLLEDAKRLLQSWQDYYAGNGSSAGLSDRTKILIARINEENRFWVPTPEEELRMVQNGEG